VMAGVPGGASCLAPSTIGFGEDADQVGAEVRSKSGSSSRRVIGQGAERAGGREGGVTVVWEPCGQKMLLKKGPSCPPHQNGGIRKVQYFLYPDLHFCLSICCICFGLWIFACLVSLFVLTSVSYLQRPIIFLSYGKPFWSAVVPSMTWPNTRDFAVSNITKCETIRAGEVRFPPSIELTLT
jgi:hypothetical protein